MRKHRQPAREPPGGLCFLQRSYQVDKRAVVNAATTLCGGDGEADREVCLAYAGWAEQHHVLLALDEVKLVQTFDLLALDRRLEGEVERFERLDCWQPR